MTSIVTKRKIPKSAGRYYNHVMSLRLSPEDVYQLKSLTVICRMSSANWIRCAIRDAYRKAVEKGELIEQQKHFVRTHD